MTTPDRDLRVLVLGASLASKSLNNRLAALAAKLVTDKGGTTDLANVGDFDCPFYDHDIEVETGPPVGAHRFSERVKAADALIVASPETDVRDFMRPDPISVSVDLDAEQVGAAIARYNLLALPVVDADGRMQGIVTVDDAFERALGEGWRKRLPEIYEPAEDR